MKDHFHSELKKEFQLERMILFSDAVFAIAITLLVIEIKVPEIPREILSEDKLAEALAEMIPKFVGFIVSFFIIGLYWTIHHRLFGFVINYNQRLLWLNLLFLFAVVLMPFSTGFYSVYLFKHLKSPVMIYVSNICFLGIMNFVLWKYIGNPKNKLSEGLAKPIVNYFSFRAIMVPIMFIIIAMIYLFIPEYALFLPMLVPLVMIIIRKIYDKKLAKKMQQTTAGISAEAE
ncbi:MAG: TMEM175 family protein [Panacibacter sp.]